LAKQVKGLKAKNNELIKEHIEMVRDKNSFGIQLQNQKLDIKRLTSLQKIQTARDMAESMSSTTQLHHRFWSSLSIPKTEEAEARLQTPADRRMSSFFAMNQISDELAQVAVRSLNVENLEPSKGPQVYKEEKIKTPSDADKICDVERKKECWQDRESKTQDFGRAIHATEQGNKTEAGKEKAKPSKEPMQSSWTDNIQSSPLLRNAGERSFDDTAQGKTSRQRIQVNYKEARLMLVFVKVMSVL
jgi:hypothetical protein